MTAAAVAFLIGLALGIGVTDRLHGQATGWGRRLGRSRFRRANLPVGGTIAALLAVVAQLAGSRELVGPLVAAAAAMAVTAIGWRYVDPLPALPHPTRENRNGCR